MFPHSYKNKGDAEERKVNESPKGEIFQSNFKLSRIPGVATVYITRLEHAKNVFYFLNKTTCRNGGNGPPCYCHKSSKDISCVSMNMSVLQLQR